MVPPLTQFATLSAVRGVAYAFMLSTPLRVIEIQVSLFECSQLASPPTVETACGRDTALFTCPRFAHPCLPMQGTDQYSVDKWSDEIVSVQSSDTFAQLVPQGMRRQHFVQWLKNKGGSIAVRLMSRPGRKKYDPVEFSELLAESRESEFSLDTILSNTELNTMLHEFAENHGSAAHLQARVPTSLVRNV